MSRFYRRPRDIEEGLPTDERRENDASRSSAYSNQCICALALFLFFLRYPLSTLGVLIVFMMCTIACMRFLMRYSRQLMGVEALSETWTQLNLFRLPSDVNIANLRLALVDRDFNANDYDMLLSLDDETGPTAAARQLTHEEMASLPLVVYETKSSKEETCSVCLETFRSGDRLRRLPCRHTFHESCIAAWLKQKGAATTCPICKKRIFMEPV